MQTIENQKEKKRTTETFESWIGLEIHAQLKTKSKMFSSDSSLFGESENQNTHPTSLGLPGALPVINQKAIEQAIKTGLALNCKINEKSIFARKNYFYPDLPKGYQISQYNQPLCVNGFVEFTKNGNKKRVFIQRAHLEEDAGKLIHKNHYSLLNLNRAGVPLLEIVTEASLLTAEEAGEFVRMVRKILCSMDTCDGNLEEGSMRCDCNISVKKNGEKKLGTRVEVKNVNSFRFIEKAIDFEIKRQIQILKEKKKVIQETRFFNPNKNQTFPLRTKEEAEDYRYFPDPDLLPLIIPPSWISETKKNLPELPFEKEMRFQKEYQLTEQEAQFLSQSPEISQIFETLCKESHNPKASAHWIMGEMSREIKARKTSFKKAHFILKHLSELIQLIDREEISGKIGKEIFPEIWEKNISPHQIIKNRNLTQIKDPEMISKLVDETISANQKQLKAYKEGKKKLFGFFVGAVMKKTKGQVRPQTLTKILKNKLDS